MQYKREMVSLSRVLIPAFAATFIFADRTLEKAYIHFYI